MTASLGRLLRRWADRIDPAGKPHRLPAHTFTLDHEGVHVRTDGQGAQLYYVGEGEFSKALVGPSPATSAQMTSTPRKRPAGGSGQAKANTGEWEFHKALGRWLPPPPPPPPAPAKGQRPR